MTAEDIKAKIIARILKLKGVAEDTRNPNEGERLSALGRIKALLDKWNLTEADLDRAAEREMADRVFNFPYPRHNTWLNFFAAFISQYYGCAALFFCEKDTDPPNSVFMGVALSGEKLDVDIAASVVEILLPQILSAADSLYDWAYLNHKQPTTSNYDTPQTPSVVITLNSGFYNSSSNASNFSFFSNFMSFDTQAANEMHRVMRNFEEVPLQNSKEWAKIEQDWGLGIVGSTVNKIQALTDYANQHDEDADLSSLLETSVDDNALVLVSKSLVQMREDKIANAVGRINGMIPDLNKMEPPEDTQQVKHMFLHQRGVQDGSKVEVQEAINKKKDK